MYIYILNLFYSILCFILFGLWFSVATAVAAAAAVMVAS